MRKSKPGFQAAFTLVELMVAMLLTVFLAGGAMLVHLSGRSTSLNVQQLTNIQESIRFASDYVIRDIRNAGFRDETFLRAGHEQQIRQSYATLLDLDEDGFEETLRVRYAGRGHCTEAFDEFRLVENEYFLNRQTGVFSCRGRTVDRDAPGSTLITAESWSDSIGLVSGFRDVVFQRICPNGGTSCACDLVNEPVDSCIGVQVALQLRGMREWDGSGDFADQTLVLNAAFRNIILERVNRSGSASEGES